MENHYLILFPFPPNKKAAKQENIFFISATQLLTQKFVKPSVDGIVTKKQPTVPKLGKEQEKKPSQQNKVSVTL